MNSYLKKTARGLWQKKKSTLIFGLLCVGCYFTYSAYSAYSHKQYVRKIHSKDFVSHNEYNSINSRLRERKSENFNAKQNPEFLNRLHDYIAQIEALRKRLLAKPRKESWPDISPPFKIVNGYNQDYFTTLQNSPQVETVFLAVNESLADRILPLKRYFDYGSTKLGCQRMVKAEWAVYHNGYELYNKSCQTDLRKTLIPNSIDRKSLSVGLPFQLSSNHRAPTGHASSNLILTFLHVIEYGLVNANGEVFTRGTCIKSQRCNTPILYPYNDTKAPIYDEVFTITEQGQIWYYHLTIEDLPRLAPYIEFLQKHPQIKVHISVAGFHLEMLSLLGISGERVVWGEVRARVLYYPAGTACGRPSVFTTSLLSLLMRHKLEQQIGKHRQDSIVIIQRSDSRRQFKNHDAIHQAVLKIANQYDLKVQIFSDNLLPSLRVYMELFYRAKVVIGPHGSGFANLIFTQPGTMVLEGLCYMEDWYKFCWKGYFPWVCKQPAVRFSLTFRNVAAVLGLRYYGVVRNDDCLYVTPEDVIKPLKFYLNNLNQSVTV